MEFPPIPSKLWMHCTIPRMKCSYTCNTVFKRTRDWFSEQLLGLKIAFTRHQMDCSLMANGHNSIQVLKTTLNIQLWGEESTPAFDSFFFIYQHIRYDWVVLTNPYRQTHNLGWLQNNNRLPSGWQSGAFVGIYSKVLLVNLAVYVTGIIECTYFSYLVSECWFSFGETINTYWVVAFVLLSPEGGYIFVCRRGWGPYNCTVQLKEGELSFSQDCTWHWSLGLFHCNGCLLRDLE